MLFAWIQLLLGGALLYFGAEWLVRGAAGMALAAGLRPVVVGLTIVAYGTSAPELTVGITSSLAGTSDLTLGNSIGSNIANLGLALGLTALIMPPRVEGGLIRRELPFLLLSALALPFVLLDGRIDRVEAAVFVAAVILYTAWLLRRTPDADFPAEDAAEQVQEAERAGAPHAEGRLRLTGLIVVGLGLLAGGGKLLVEGAVDLATIVGISERVIGLTIVAVGTSMPELATSIIAAVRGHASLAVGNIIGSNIFNILLILGVAAGIRPLEARTGDLRLDIGFMLGMTIVACIAFRKERTFGRVEGGVFLAAYVAFLGLLVFGA